MPDAAPLLPKHSSTPRQRSPGRLHSGPGAFAALLLLAGHPALAEDVILSYGSPLPIGDSAGNWVHAFPAEDGNWTVFRASGGAYHRRTMLSDYSMLDDEEALNDSTVLVDHAITACPDGSWLHVASANLSGFDDSAYAFRYDADWNVIASGAIAESDPDHFYNDAPVLCSGFLDGAPFGARDTSSGASPFGIFVPVDAAAEPDAALPFRQVPVLGGSSILYDEESDQIISVRSFGDSPELTIMRYDHDLNEIDTLVVQVMPDDGIVRWPQGLIRYHDYFFVGHVGINAAEADDWITLTGNVYVEVFDKDWNHVQSVQVTDEAPTQGAMGTFLAAQDDVLIVTYNHAVNPTLVELKLDPTILEETDPGDTGTPGDTATPGDTNEPGDSAPPSGEDSGQPDVDPGSPVADAGPDRQISLGQSVQVDGSESQSLDHGTLSYRWTLESTPSGSELTDTHLTQADEALCRFTPDREGRYTLRLTVTEAEISAADEVEVQVDSGGCACGTVNGRPRGERSLPGAPTSFLGYLVGALLLYRRRR